MAVNTIKLKFGRKNKMTYHSDRLIHCKECAHLCYEDLGIYYCGLHRISGQLSPDDYCSRAEDRKEDHHEDH